ncbi:MAG: aminopeptidase [Bacteroidales bacterium]
MKPGIILVLSAFLLSVLYGCANVCYLSQAAEGHFRLMGARVPIEKILRKNLLDSASRDKLRMVLDIREFASRELGLPANKSYTVYSEIKGEHLGWNVYCAPEFSVEPKTWCFPVAGCVVYRGYFSQKAALRFAAKMEKEGFDVYVSPIGAYSTLGWYNDPVLSTHLQRGPISLAGLIIHELAHQQLYIKGDSQFNEGFAVCVERAWVLRWLRSSAFIQSSERDSLIAEALKMWDAQDLYNAKILAARSRLKEIYSNDSADIQKMRQKKDSLLRGLESELLSRNNVKGNKISLNNAFFVPVSTYYETVPEFEKILEGSGGNFQEFYRKAREKQN